MLAIPSAGEPDDGRQTNASVDAVLHNGPCVRVCCWGRVAPCVVPRRIVGCPFQDCKYVCAIVRTLSLLLRIADRGAAIAILRASAAVFLRILRSFFAQTKQVNAANSVSLVSSPSLQFPPLAIACHPSSISKSVTSTNQPSSASSCE